MPPRARRWLSQGLEHLQAEAEPPTCDVLIVGSGYGGAMAAAELAGYTDAHTGKPARVYVLERGEEYLPGSFPSDEAVLPGHLRFSTPNAPTPRGQADGLFDVRVGEDVCVLLANGLGGGSLINAGVLAQPLDQVLAGSQWPSELQRGAALQPYFEQARSALRATGARGPDATILQHIARSVPLKFTALERLGTAQPGSFTAATLATAMTAGPNSADVEMQACTLCGNCATGCNEQAKNSLDENLLVTAWRHGARIFTGATVLKVEPLSNETGWQVHVVHTNPQLRRHQAGPLSIRTRRVILAAGTLGSTEILLRSRSDALSFSLRLGAGFSGNGDMFVVAHGQAEPANALAAEPGSAPAPPGPSITGMLDLRAYAEQMVVQEFAIPGPLRRLFTESFTLANTLRELGQADLTTHAPTDAGLDPCAVDADVMQRTLPLGLIGHDDAGGRIELIGTLDAAQGDGAVRVRWPTVERGDLELRMRRLETLLERSRSGGHMLANPISRLLPEELGSLLGTPRGPALTVHPLGGCWMGEDAERGVVDHLGRVFDPARGPQALHEGLMVLDGSIVPGSLGINPSLTIAALALRAVTLLREQWMVTPLARQPRLAGLLLRPVYRVPTPEPTPVPTKVSVLERLTGTAMLQLADGSVRSRVVQLTLRFAPVEVRSLMGALQRRLRIAPGSQLRVFEPRVWAELSEQDSAEQVLDERAELVADVSGTMQLLQREASSVSQRRWRALFAWLRNRGLRDLWQTLAAQWRRPHIPDGTRPPRLPLQLRRRIELAWNLASRAGAVRRFDYELEVGHIAKLASSGSARFRLDPGARVRGHKRFTYGCLSNPWLQLQELTLSELPGLTRSARHPAVLTLDTRYLARARTPLFQLTEQSNGARALFDMVSFLLYVLRLIITIHVWSFRKPDASTTPSHGRLAGIIPGIPEPQITQLRVLSLSDQSPAPSAYVQLARYARAGGSQPPVLLIHGYSANSQSFAHPAVEPNLAGYLWQQGRDVWVIDLRTSSGMLTAQEPWTFEDVAYTDVPAAIEHVLQTTSAMQVDVIAHCMGAAMFSMAMLGTVDEREPYARIRHVLPRRVRSAVFLQVAPRVVFTPENIFRAYAMSYVRSALHVTTYAMRPPPDPTLADDVLDRLLATVPYPYADREIEQPRNPLRSTAFAGTRHRMDALFGRVFNSQNIAPEVLACIDDLFGPICLGTVFQTAHFAARDAITTHDGRNEFATAARVLQRWADLPTLSIQGTDNGLASAATAQRTAELMAQAGMRHYHWWTATGFGHQDVLIGKRAVEVFARIAAFLADPGNYRAADVMSSAPLPEPSEPQVCLPLGPLLRRSSASGVRVVLALDDAQPSPKFIATLLVGRVASGLQALAPSELHSPVAADGWTAPLDVAVQWPASAVGLLVLLVQDPSAAGPARIEAAVQRFLASTDVAALQRALVPRPLVPSSALCFLVASCQYPVGPLDRPIAEDSYARMARLLQEAEPARAPQFLVLAGDQIYADATAGLLDPTHRQERYRARYEALFRMAPLQTVLRQIDAYWMLDDHEIADNWEPGATLDARSQEFFDSGVAAYVEYQRRLDPPPCPRTLWHTQSLQGYPFFFSDTRTERQQRQPGNMGAARIMGESQFASLLDFIGQSDGSPRFVVSASLLLPRRLGSGPVYDAMEVLPAHLHSDAWDGFPDSLRRLLGCIARRRIANLVFLSGDEHLFCAARIELIDLSEPLAPPVVVHSIHCSGLYAPYPFANGGTARFAGVAQAAQQSFDETRALTTLDEFAFTDPQSQQRFGCRVLTDLAPAGDGFAVLRCTPSQQQWLLEYEFRQRGDHVHSGSALLTMPLVSS